MSAFPRLASVFGGVPVDRLDARAVRYAIEEGVREDEQLDWKSEPYKRGDRDEIAKDIAAFANAAGGVIVIGVREDKHGAAAEEVPFQESVDALGGKVRSVCHAKIRPFVKVDVRPIKDDTSDGWFMAIIVPKSRDAPHALVEGNSGGKGTFSFPIRDGASTRWMSEAELGPRYRDRYESRDEYITRLRAIHDRGVTEIHRPGYPWLSMACVPTEPGARPAGASAREAETKFLENYTQLTYGVAINPRAHYPIAAVGRTIVSDQPTRRNRSREIHAELGRDGSGMLACVHNPVLDQTVGTSLEVDEQGQASWLASDRVEWALYTSMLFLTEHAIDTNAAGELEFIAQLHSPGGHVGVCTPADRASFHDYHGDHLLHTTRTTASRATVPIGNSLDHHAIAAGTFTLATDILAEFSVDEPRLFTHDGYATTANAHHSWAETGVRPWIEANLNRPTEPADTADSPPPTSDDENQ